MENDEEYAQDSSGDDVADMTRSSFLLCQRGLKKYFNLHDANGDGQISAGELQLFLGKMGARMTDQEAREGIAEVDLDKDGYINFKEFVIAILDDFYEVVRDQEEAEACWFIIPHQFEHRLSQNIPSFLFCDYNFIDKITGNEIPKKLYLHTKWWSYDSIL